MVIDFRHAAGDPDLMLYNSAGRELLCLQSISDTESISLAGLDVGVYFLRVFPDELPGNGTQARDGHPLVPRCNLPSFRHNIASGVVEPNRPAQAVPKGV